MMIPALTRGLVAAAVAMVVMAFVSARSALIDKGEARAVAKVEKRNETVRKKATAAGRKSVDPAVGGVLNPYLRE
jgi:hypothetical protein